MNNIKNLVMLTVISLLVGSGATYALLKGEPSHTPADGTVASDTATRASDEELIFRSLVESEKNPLIAKLTPDWQFFYTYSLRDGHSPAEAKRFFDFVRTNASSGDTIDFSHNVKQLCYPSPLILGLKHGAELKLTNQADKNITIRINNQDYQVQKHSGTKFVWDFGPVGTIAEYQCHEENVAGDARGYIYVLP